MDRYIQNYNTTHNIFITSIYLLQTFQHNIIHFCIIKKEINVNYLDNNEYYVPDTN